MYTVYQVVLIAEDGEYVISDWQTQERAIIEVEKIKDNYGDGQSLAVRPLHRSF